MASFMELLQEEWICPINKSEMFDPVLTADGHTY